MVYSDSVLLTLAQIDEAKHARRHKNSRPTPQPPSGTWANTLSTYPYNNVWLLNVSNHKYLDDLK
jgi:hypothetical protein